MTNFAKHVVTKGTDHVVTMGTKFVVSIGTKHLFPLKSLWVRLNTICML